MTLKPIVFALAGFLASATANAQTLAQTAAVPNVTVTAPRITHTIDPVRLNHACAVTLGLDPSEEPYGVCVQTLEQTLAALDYRPAPAK